jgi:membrane associated rhomboid family serine protease
MLLPYNVDVPMARLPVANWVLIAFTSIVSLAILLGIWPGEDTHRQAELEAAFRKLQDKNATSKDFDEALRAARRHAEEPVPPLALRPGAFSPPQLVSCLFVHADLAHLLGNMLFLFVFGNAVNAKLGHGLFLAAYLALGALAGAAWLLVGDGRPVVGASGAIMGAVGIFLVLFPRNEVRVFYLWALASAGVVTIASGWLILFYLGCDLLGALFGGGGPVAYAAHLAGAAGGIALAWMLVAWGWAGPTRYEENLLQVLGFADREERGVAEAGRARPSGRRRS